MKIFYKDETIFYSALFHNEAFLLNFQILTNKHLKGWIENMPFRFVRVKENVSSKE